MPVRRTVGACALTAMLGACAGPVYFEKPGMTHESFNKDRYECLKENQVPYSYSTVSFSRYYSGGGSGSGVRVDPGMAQACMEGRGYHRVAKKSEPGQTTRPEGSGSTVSDVSRPQP